METNQNGYQFAGDELQSKKDHKFLKGALFGALIMCFFMVGIFLAAGVLTGGSQYEYTSGVVDKETQEKLNTIRLLGDMYFLYDLDEESLNTSLIEGYVAGFDDVYTAYYDEEATQQLMESTTGVYSGVGAVMTQNYQTWLVEITNVYKNSPAEKAGLKEGDILLSVDGREIGNEDLSEIVTWIKGEKGTEVKLGVYRDGEELELTAIRDTIEAITVEYEMKDNKTGYIQVAQFEDVTLEQYNNAMDDLRSQGMERLIVDLRGNPGGNLDTVCDMLRTMLPKGLIVYTENKNGERTEYTNDKDSTFDLPLVVLVDGNSASASEIFTGAVQDYGIGTIVGTTTYGKGVVQSLIDLHDGTLLKITISEYFTPSGRSIHGIGIEPDVVVEYQINKEDENADNQLEKAMEVVNGL